MKYSEYFKTKKRKDGTSFSCLVDNAPEQLKEWVREIHFDSFDGCLPNDWIYCVTHDAFLAIEDDEITKEEIYEIEADPYYSDLYRWFGEPFAHGYCQQVREELDMSFEDVYKWISCAQAEAKQAIHRHIWDYLNA